MTILPLPRILPLIGTLLLLISFVSSTANASPRGINEAHWRGTGTVMATMGDLQATDNDLFLYSILLGGVPPALVMDWKNQDPAQQEILREFTRQYFQTLIAAEFIREGRSQTATEMDFANRVSRLMAAPAAQVLWADQVVRNKIRLFPEDVLHRYKMLIQQDSADDVVNIIRLQIPYASDAPLEERNRAANRARELRAKAIQSGGLAVILREDPTLRPQGIEGPEEVRRRDDRFDNQVRAEAFRLGVSQISNVIRTPRGAFLIEVIDRGRAEVPTLEQVRSNLERDLKRAFLPQQFNYQLAKIRPTYFPTNRGNLYQFMPDDADIMRVGRFAITLDEFKRLHPEFAPKNGRFNVWAVEEHINNLIDGEVITQELQKEGLTRDPFYTEALRMAEKLFLSYDWIQSRRATLTVSDEELAEFLPTWMEDNQPGTQKNIWRLEIEVLESAGALEESERDAKRLLMESYLNFMVQEDTDQITARAEVAGHVVIRNPQQVIDGITPPRDDRFRINFRRLGVMDRRQATSTIQTPWENLQVGSFTLPRMQSSTTMASYYVSEEVADPAISPDDFREDARTALVETLSLQPLKEKLNEAMERDEIIFHAAIAP
ncbi:MAG: peptidyl-prolyl cis-trans isomerase [Candidatus Sumerlaeia bacterium]|nr:peptidyl-prolyl cis-trans isomerase [Candidatus Sumerlaeia bacterium]